MTAAPRPAPGGRVHDTVVRALAGAVLGGRHRPGDVLPREADLALELGVSRTSLREAVKVLAAKGLLEARPRVGVRVRPRENWQLLDPAVLSWHPDFRGDRDLVQDLVEARRIIEPCAAELAARRGTAADLAAIEAAYLAMRAAIPGDVAACCEADLAFHRSVIVASGNVVLRGLAGTIEAALRAVFGITNQLMTSQSRALAAHGDVLDRIRFRDAAGARAAMERLLDIAQDDCQSLGELPS
jgi:GntR family transcriptional regulator, galactonate operon transcriptional repressor